MQRFVTPQRVIGLELEYESVSARNSQESVLSMDTELATMWTVHTDGSLRPSDMNTEYVLRAPMSVANTVRGLEKLLDHIDRVALPYTISWRCGLHLHLDFRMRPQWQVQNSMILCSFLDPLIFLWDGHGRQESKFCLPCYETYTLISSNRPQTRYGSVNPSSIERHGSLEFRHAQSTLDLAKIVDYINIITGITLHASKVRDPDELIESLAGSACLYSWCHDNLHPLASDPLLSAPGARGGRFTPTTKAISAALVYKNLMV